MKKRSFVVARDAGVVLGHSLGEYSALYAAGCLTFEDTLRLVRARGLAMASSPSGSMAALIPLSFDSAKDLVKSVQEKNGQEVCAIANVNTPKQVVISGTPNGVHAAIDEGKKSFRVRKAVKLQVGGAFHSPLMEGAKEELKKELDTLDFSDPSVPLISNVTALPLSKGDAIKASLLEQLTRPVLWSDSLLFCLQSESLGGFIEVGASPSKVLSSLLSQVSSSSSPSSSCPPCVALGSLQDFERLNPE